MPSYKIWPDIKSPDFIQVYLDRVNGRAKTFTYSSPEDIFLLARRGERRLDELGIAKKHRPGTQLHARGGGSGKSYSRKARYCIATSVVLVRGHGYWFIKTAARSEIASSEAEKFDIHLSDTAQACAAHTLCADLHDSASGVPLSRLWANTDLFLKILNAPNGSHHEKLDLSRMIRDARSELNL